MKRIMTGAVGALVAACLFSLFAERVVRFEVLFDGGALPFGVVPRVSLDGESFASGRTATWGRHELRVSVPKGEVVGREFWTVWGSKNLGTISVPASRGSAVVGVGGEGTRIRVMGGGVELAAGSAPLLVTGLVFASYAVEIARDGYVQCESLGISNTDTTHVEYALRVGEVRLSSGYEGVSFALCGESTSWSGTIPAVFRTVPQGAYRLEVCRDGWVLTNDLKVVPGAVIDERVTFPYGAVRVESDAAFVTASVGRASAALPSVFADLVPGVYSVVATDGAYRRTQEVSVVESQTSLVRIAFNHGAIALQSRPAGARVLCEGREVGKTPLLLGRIPAGSYLLDVQLEGYASTALAVRVGSAETNVYDVRLLMQRYVDVLSDARGMLAEGKYEEAMELAEAARSVDPEELSATSLIAEIRKAEAAAAAAKVRVAREKVRSVVERAIEAVGGRDVLARYPCREFEWIGFGKMGDGVPYTNAMRVVSELPDKLRIDETVTFVPRNLTSGLIRMGVSVRVNGVEQTLSKRVVVARGLHGGDGWLVVDGVRRPVPPLVYRSMQDTLHFSRCEGLLYLLEPGVDLSISHEDELFPGNTALLARVEGRPDVILFFNPLDGKPTGMRSRTVNATEETIIVAKYSNFQSVRGVLMPMRVEQTLGGGEWQVVNYKRVGVSEYMEGRLFAPDR